MLDRVTSNRPGVRGQTRRRIGAGLGAGLALLLAAAVAGMLHVIAQRHYLRLDVSRGRSHGLSDATLRTLGRLTNIVDVTVVFRSGAELQDLMRLLEDYRAVTPRVRVARVDPDRDVARLKELTQEYPLTVVDSIVVAAGGRSRILDSGDLSSADRRAGDGDVDPPRGEFHGERAITSAIQDVCHERAPVIYALTGHGERPIDNTDRLRGFAQAARMIRQEGIELRALEIDEAAGVPADADALLIAGPRTRIPQPELDAIHAFLDRNGRALILLDSGTASGLEGLLRRWNVRVGDDEVMEAGRTMGGGLVIGRFAPHDATRSLQTLICVLYSPRSVEPDDEAEGLLGGADRPRVTRMALTGDRGWAETDPDQRPLTFDEGRDRKGPVSVAAAVERGLVGDLDVRLRPTRMIVIGDSTFAANGAMVSGNADLFLGSIHWLLDRPAPPDIPPRRIETSRIEIVRPRLRILGVIVIAGMPLLAALAGCLVWMARRS